MIVLAAIRPDSWNLPVFVHVLGAMTLVGGLATALAVQGLAWRRNTPADAVVLGRWAFRALLFVALPAWIVMRVGAQWAASKESLGDASLSWIDIGYITADGGGVLLLVAIVLAGFGARRLVRSDGAAGTLSRVAAAVAAVALVAYLVTVWAMTTKPV